MRNMTSPIYRTIEKTVIPLLPLFSRNRPVLIALFITDLCNLHCVHCFSSSENKSPLKQELTIDEIEKISLNLPLFPWLLITGGEPFMREDVSEITRIFLLNNRVTNITIPTNGMFPDKIVNWIRETEKFRLTTQYNLNFSIHGLSEMHDLITGIKGSFKRLMKTVSLIQSDVDKRSDLRIVFNVTLMQKNQDHLESALIFLKSKFPTSRINLGVVRGKPRDPEQKLIAPEKYLLAARYIVKHPYHDLKSSWLNRFFSMRDRMVLKRIYQTLKKTVSYRPCLAGRLSLVINESGDVFACELLDQTLGNLRDYQYQFQKLWHSQARYEILKKIKEARCSCPHECNQIVNNVYNPNLLLRHTLYSLFRDPGRKRFWA
ncbi:radical SAM/SPASM domain-containing protein [candidate division CSSED10-310 bacterium]|uniref:Radical SAM/SPASM domain-containing protein n=1 Tax=candidate division CSSED10-310 bacterium TaxID=2855610 RepID=A0ABV6YSV4_UNCC1